MWLDNRWRFDQDGTTQISGVRHQLHYTKKNLITYYDKDINWCLLPTQLKISQRLLAETNSYTSYVEDLIVWFKVASNQSYLPEVSKLLQPYLLQMQQVKIYSLLSKEWRCICTLPWHEHDSTLACFCTCTTTLIINYTLKKFIKSCWCWSCWCW